MNTERWEKVGQLFDEALAIDPASRCEFLDRRCGSDEDLRAQVEALLVTEDSTEHSAFLNPEVVSASSVSIPAGVADPMIGQRLGNYEIKKRIGRGGMGNVYLATRSEDFKQRVAIKLLKRGMDSEEILRKFRMEIRVLAALGQHPNIARLLDAGTTDSGSPYFVMEYVEGSRIDQYCDTNRLSVLDRLKLIEKVASAVHFAHQHTVIHRDLKPSNILVSNTGQAKLIDFGIAKITAPELGDETAEPTRTAYRAMTPEYASPEQLRGDSLTTATDVYSLGVLLYELLTGRRPTDATGDATQLTDSQVGLREFPKPSAVVLSPSRTSRRSKPPTETTAADIASLRSTSPQALRSQLQGDLDNLVGMAIRNDPNRRFASAGQLAADIQRFLSGEPIVARPLSQGERLWRTCCRNRIAASTLIAMLAGTLFGLVYLSQLATQLVRRSALQSAAQQTEMLLHGHKYYTQVLSDVREASPDAADELKPPATFTIELFEFLSQSKSRNGTQARLLSRFPFAPRADRAPLDEFELAALDKFEQENKKSHHEFSDFHGEPSLRYGISMRMEQSCVDCHNTHPDSTKTDWKVGDVRGVIEVIRPLASDVHRTRKGMQHALGWMGILFCGMFATAAVVFRERRR